MKLNVSNTGKWNSNSIRQLGNSFQRAENLKHLFLDISKNEMNTE